MRLLAICLILAALAGEYPGLAQESRGTIAGRVTDPQGAVIPGVAVVVTNNETNAISRSETNQTGYFEINLLNPGMYAVTVEAAGFKKLTRAGLELNVGGRIEVELVLQVGQLSESIEVTAAAPLLDITTPSGGRVISRRQILDLPFPDQNPFMMSWFAPGMYFTGAFKDTKPWDNGAISSFNTMGAVGYNEYTIDGAPATGTNKRVGYAPPSDAIEEFKVETTSFDAAYGHTSGAAINVMTRSGSNDYHGAIFDQHYQDRWNATPHFTRLAWESAVRAGLKSPNDPKQPSGRLNDTGAALGGPVRIPKLYNGRDKLFFFFNYTGIWLRSGSAGTSTVPEMSWRQGDFSDLLKVDPVKYTVYDPRSARLDGSRVVRTPFPGNKGVPVLNPMYQAYEKIYPQPNHIGASVTPDGFNNYTSFTGGGGEDYYALMNRIDYNINERHRVFGRWYVNHRLSLAGDWSRDTIPGLHRSGLVRQDKGVGGDYLWAIGVNGTLDLGVSWNRFGEGNDRPVQISFKPTDVGLPAYMDAKAGDYHQLPYVSFSSLPDISNSYPKLTSLGGTGEIKLGMTRILGSHSLKWGWNERRYWFAGSDPGYSSGSFSFNNTYVRAADNTNTAANQGLEWAAFMMGVPSGISIDTNDSALWSTRFRAFYFQDDWRFSSRLRLSLGLRYEREGGITERFNRGLAGGFLASAKLPITDAAQAAYAASPLPELPASQFQVLGGTQYLGGATPTFSDGTHRLLPRAGAVYQLNSKTVLRGGYGWFYDSYNSNNSRPSQYGYSQPTGTTVSSDLGLTFCCGTGAVANLAAGRTPLNDPFPVRADGTRFDQPYGNTLGMMAFVGRGATALPRDYAPAFQQRWRLSLQREIHRDMVLDISYNGSWARIPVNQRVDYLPAQYWASGNTRNQAVDDDMNRNVTNPFNIKNFAALQTTAPVMYKYMSVTSFFTGSTIRKNVLLRQFPQMNGLTGLRPGESFADSRGASRYHDLQVQFEKRFSHGLQTSLMYTRAYAEASDNYFNQFDAAPSWRPNNSVFPHRLIWTAIYELPFGKGKPFVQTGFTRHLLGGWQVAGVYQYQTGPDTSWSNLFYYGDVNSIATVFKHDQVHASDIHVWFDPSIAYKGTGAIPAGFVGFEGRSSMQPGSYQARMFPTLLDALRADGIRNWDARVQRRFSIREDLRVNFSADALNLMNHTNFSAPNTDPTSTNFGRVTGQNGYSRRLQFNLRIEF